MSCWELFESCSLVCSCAMNEEHYGMLMCVFYELL